MKALLIETTLQFGDLVSKGSVLPLELSDLSTEYSFVCSQGSKEIDLHRCR